MTVQTWISTILEALKVSLLPSGIDYLDHLTIGIMPSVKKHSTQPSLSTWGICWAELSTKTSAITRLYLSPNSPSRSFSSISKRRVGSFSVSFSLSIWSAKRIRLSKRQRLPVRLFSMVIQAISQLLSMRCPVEAHSRGSYAIRSLNMLSWGMVYIESSQILLS